MTAASPAMCSFCGRFNAEVEVMIAGPVAFICSGCVELAVGVIAKRRTQRDLERCAGCQPEPIGTAAP